MNIVVLVVVVGVPYQPDNIPDHSILVGEDNNMTVDNHSSHSADLCLEANIDSFLL